MLESISTTSLSSPIKLAEWSPKMDIIAITYHDAPETIELRRMDWTKVNSITLDYQATVICYTPNGRMICVGTADNKLQLFGIEDCKVISSMVFDNEITAVSIDECNEISITAVGFADGTVSLFSDFHFALCQYHLIQPAIKITLCDTEVFLLHEDHQNVSHFSITFIESDSALIKSTSKAFSSYWMHYHTIDNAVNKLNERWNQIWEESASFTSHNEDIARCFLLGKNPPELSTEVHITRISKSIAHEFSEIQNLLANDIIPSFIELDKTIEQIKAAIEMSSKLDISLYFDSSKSQIQNCLTMMENFRRLSNCFNALFGYLLNPASVISELAKANVSTNEFTDFLINYFHKFDLLDISIGQSPESKPIFEATHKADILLPARFSNVSKEKCSCIGQTLSVYDLKEQEETTYQVSGQPLAAYPFSDGCVGCFFESGGSVYFKMFEDENESQAEVSLEDSAVFFISPRRIALVQSTEMFASVVDLEIPEDE
ncbi:hypothetical protein TRFO_02980 [Tritrichomonas foetus]|uniref:Anaphase-promoting complex subunit 4-like WD40 domain-containing protein n=1 Tax=Tritrichomonas foetus TaxID=1144522 RepID=A0A1J4KYS1_9EUKA|nr:hypothetical protein TRFO_02980 [Tritrichomonas foetus]|eukprot:OHT14725.1 hypothetical protein TRFO_02980 [Tritrichomonas foetus]